MLAELTSTVSLPSCYATVSEPADDWHCMVVCKTSEKEGIVLRFTINVTYTHVTVEFCSAPAKPVVGVLFQ